MAVDARTSSCRRACSRRREPLASIVMPVGVPLAVRLGERERGDRLAGRDAREQLALLVVGAGVQDRVRREHDRREVRRAQQHAALLLEHDAELDEREALAAVRLGDVRGSAARAPGPSASRPRGRSPRSSPSGGAPRSTAPSPPGTSGRRRAAGPAPPRTRSSRCCSFFSWDCGYLGSRGSPSTRSPMMLRWISLAPA